MKFNNLVAKDSEVQSTEKKELSWNDRIIYPSSGSNGKKVDLVITLMESDYDLDPLMTVDGRTVKNPNCSIKVVHTLPKMYGKKSSVVSNKRIIPFQASKDMYGADGEAYLRKGQFSAYYDKKAECIFEKAMNEWKSYKGNNENAKKFASSYRRSLILPVKAFLWEAVITENGETRVEAVNMPVVVGLNVQDLFYTGRTGFGKSLIKLATDPDGNLLETFKLVLTTEGLSTKARKGELTKEDLKTVENSRRESYAMLDDLMPLEYDEALKLIESGLFSLVTPSSFENVTPVAKDNVVISKIDYERILKEYSAEEEEDLPPF